MTLYNNIETSRLEATVSIGHTEQSNYSFLRARMIGAAFAVLVQGALFSVFLIYQQASFSTNPGVGRGDSEVSVSLLGNIKPARVEKSAAARSYAAIFTKPSVSMPRPASATVVNSAGSSADNDVASTDGMDLGGGGPSPTPAALSFQRQLLAYIENFRRYPPEARREQQEGSVELLFAMDRNGLVLGIWVKRSSGNPVLDREAVATVLRAQPMPAIPGELPAPLNITLPIVFGLAL